MRAKSFYRELLILFISIHLIFISVIRAETTIEIDNPRFTEKGLNDKIYEIKAKKGFKTEENLKLIFIEGKFKSSEGTWIYLEADSGNFSQKLNTITLENNVHFYTDNDESFKSEFATFDIKNDLIELTNNVKHISNRGIIIAENSIIDDFEQVSYLGNVETKITFEN